MLPQLIEGFRLGIVTETRRFITEQKEPKAPKPETETVTVNRSDRDDIAFRRRLFGSECLLQLIRVSFQQILGKFFRIRVFK
jgi:hypothetical protein